MYRKTEIQPGNKRQKAEKAKTVKKITQNNSIRYDLLENMHFRVIGQKFTVTDIRTM